MPGIVEPESTEKGDTPADLPIDDTPSRPFIVLKQDVEIEIDFARQRVHGQTDIFIGTHDQIPVVYIDARQCEIDTSQITVSNCKVEASYLDPCDLLQTPKNYRLSASHWAVKKRRMKPLLHHRRKEISAVDHELKCCTPLNGSISVKLPTKPDIILKNQYIPKPEQQDLLIDSEGNVGCYRVRIPFKVKNTSDGFQFVGCNERDTRYPHVYTRHSLEPGTASAIFPCIDDPGSRNSWNISVTCPRTLGDAFRRTSVAQQSKGFGDPNGNRKRKRDEEDPQDYENSGSCVELTEEDKMLDLTVVCAGYLTGEVVHKDDSTKKTMSFLIERNKAVQHVGFAVGPFEHVDLWSEFRREEDDNKLNRNAIKIHGYCLPGRSEEVRNTCCTLVTAMDYLVLSFGRFPFENYKICFVDDMIEDTIPLCAFSLCSSRLLYPRDIMENEVEVVRKLTYSLSCQWFGVNIVPNTKADIWLVVGIAWYLTDHFMKYLCGNNDFRFRMKSMADRLVKLDIRRPCLQDLGEHLYLGDFEVDFMNLKAPLVLFILDRRISKSASNMGVYKIIGRMVTKANTSGQPSDEILGADAFRRACEKAGNQRLEPFWNQWVLSSGCPRFDVNQRFNKKRLCVEMTIQQKQDAAYRAVNILDKNDFWRGVMEESHAVRAGEFQQSFTGPMTIRIHEADGTPYEHIVELREDTAKAVKFEIPYNTKYKRLKRNRRQRERQMANNSKANDDAPRDLYYLGDVMQHPDEMEAWDFREWDDETETKMDQESYEWIRMDADFEWICEIQTNMPAYMYASQLQQDRDVVAQQDSMCYLHRAFSNIGTHPLMATILARTVLDARYYYGIRLMAIDELPNHATTEATNWGLKHLLQTYKHFFYDPKTKDPLPNDFSDKRQYWVQCAIIEAIARIRGEDGKCPKEVRRFILEQLQRNDNSCNIYADDLYICVLIKALAICQIPDKTKQKKPDSFEPVDVDEDEDEVMAEPIDTEPEQFCELVLEEIDRLRRMDEHSPSFENCFTIAALDAYCRLMKAEVIKKNPARFIEYLQDRTYDLVRIKACESLVELGMLANRHFVRMFLLIASTDTSPFVRDQVFKVLCRGLASVAIGEGEQAEEKAPIQPTEDGLIVEQDDAVMEANKNAKARKEDLSAALAALKAETTDDEDLQEAIWKAMDSPVLTTTEQLKFLELCSVLFDEDQSLMMCFPYPSYWKVERGEKIRNRCLMKFKRRYRTKPRKPRAIPKPPPPKPEPKRTITLNLNRSMSMSAKAATPTAEAPPPLHSVAPTPKPPATASTPKVTIPSLKQATTSKEKVSTPTIKEPTTQEPAPKKLKQSIAASASRSATPSASQDKPKEKSKMGESHRDSISVQPPVRPTIESQQPDSKAAVPKTNGSTLPTPAKLPKAPKPLKRTSTESEDPRPTKFVKLNTSKIPRKELEKLEKRPKAQKPKKLVTVKFAAWDKLRKRKSKTPQAGSIRATAKHRRPDEKHIGKSPRPSIGPASPAPRISESSQARASSAAVSSSQNQTATPNSSFKSASQSSQSGANSEKKRKPLPEMRKPLPSSAPTNNPTPPSKQPSSVPATASKAPTKLKIKLKAPTSGSN
ncbi:uncharacterized protein GGS22DRAFT_49209 [Annulohypoxylon maeteangense]|uniref:uncharacterized protein n=1 Tax=Annulohypoxylon maeteangense TaxID=1927788 RepID=UPI0020080814|nr:uncharacterized protein GGS22DRAFT_49209 [Annulohypoxylon maeteangense]KAI0882217.1 hypothetical protein GGS22DRAFT_49209 [Annulohypoxylon maeteangense]